MSNFADTKKQVLTKRRDDLIEEWTALSEEMSRTLDPAHQLRLQRRADDLQSRINDLEQQLAQPEAAAQDVERTNAPSASDGERQGHWNMPYERNPFFTGRDTELALLRDTFSSHRNGALTQAIRGLGGQGKSSVAVEYAFRCHEREPGYPAYDTILWTRADSVTDLYTGYGKIAGVIPVTLLRPDDPQQVVADVRRWLETNANWLLIYDNADDPDLLEPFRPRNANGHILLTSRASSFKGHLGIKQPIELRSLRPEDAVSFLFDRTSRKPEEEGKSEQQSAAALAAQLGYFPLALEQAAAYIAAEDISFTDYLADFRKREQELLNETPPETGDYRFANEREYKTLRTTWDLNFRAAEQSNPATAELLRFAAFLASDDIPYRLIVIGASEFGSPLSDVFASLQDETDLVRACDSLLKPLLRYSLIEKNRNEHTFSVHRMVQSVQRDRLNTERQEWIERTVRAVCAAFPNPEFANWAWCAALLPHALTCLTYARERSLETNETTLLLNRIGYYLVEHGLYLQAEPLYQEALVIRQKTLPEGHPAIANSLNNLAALYKRQGRYAEAEPLYREALAIQQKTLSEGHPDIAISMNNLAGLYSSQGRYAEAEPLYRDALVIFQKALPEGHPDIATSLNNLAVLYDNQGRYGEAEPLYRDVLAMRQQALPEGHPDIASSLNNLAELYSSQYRYAEAEPLYRYTLAIRRKALPENHPDIAQSLNNLAALYYSQGRDEAAEPLFQDALKLRQKFLPEDHPDIAVSLNNLALLYRNQGRDDAAEPLFRDALAIRRKALPEGHSAIATGLNNLAELYSSQGRYAEAEPLYREASSIMVRALGVEHPTTQGVLNNYVVFMSQQGRQQQAVDFLQGLGLALKVEQSD